MYKRFNTMVVKYHFCGKGGSMWKTTLKYFSEPICAGYLQVEYN